VRKQVYLPQESTLWAHKNPQIISENTVLIADSNTWIEGNAIQQFQNTARLPQMRRVAGMPDLHAGRGYPIGAVFFSVGHFYPALIGNDIGCGMALWQTDLHTHKAKPAKLAKQLGSIDAPLDESWQARINAILPQPISFTVDERWRKTLPPIGPTKMLRPLIACKRTRATVLLQAFRWAATALCTFHLKIRINTRVAPLCRV